jgi:C1A family cysteine protease
MRLSFLALQFLKYQNMSMTDIHLHHYMHKIQHNIPRRLQKITSYAGESFPESLDWRDMGVVSPVRSQGHCNSCWAFAGAGSLEYWLKKEKPNAEVNVQDILECSPHTYQCLGGLMEDVFEYKGLFSLGYEYSDHETKKCTRRRKGVRAKGFQVVTVNPEKHLLYMLNTWGPVSVGVDFTRQHDYKKGIIKAEDCNNDANHAVLVVGYKPDYWIVKNSKGTDWGHEGYAYLERGKKACGIDTYASVATGIEIV